MTISAAKKARDCCDWLMSYFADQENRRPEELTVLVAATFSLTAEAAREHIERSRIYSADIGPMRSKTFRCEFEFDWKWRNELWTLLPSLMGEIAKEMAEERRDKIVQEFAEEGEVKLAQYIFHERHRMDVCGLDCQIAYPSVDSGKTDSDAA